MPQRAKLGYVLISAFALLVTSLGPALAQELPQPMCRLMIDEENMELLDARIAVSLARSAFTTYEEVFGLIEQLWQADAIQRMKYVQAKYDRDAAKLTLEQADLILQRQEILLEQYGMICDRSGSAESKRGRARRIEEAYLRYRTADCETIAKEIEIAETNLKFDREWLQSILDLRTGEVATKVDVLLAELEVEQEEKRLTDAKRRTDGCRQDLAELKGEADTP
jgi:hypothetical protein